MPAAKRSRKSGARVSTKRGKNLKASLDDAVTKRKHSVSDEEDVEQKTPVAKRTKTDQTSVNSERWIPYFRSEKLHALDDGDALQLAAAGDEQDGDSKGLETVAMQVRLQLSNDFHTLIEVGEPGELWNCDLTRTDLTLL